jgi:hypothetical protein
MQNSCVGCGVYGCRFHLSCDEDTKRNSGGYLTTDRRNIILFAPCSNLPPGMRKAVMMNPLLSDRMNR